MLKSLVIILILSLPLASFGQSANQNQDESAFITEWPTLPPSVKIKWLKTESLTVSEFKKGLEFAKDYNVEAMIVSAGYFAGSLFIWGGGKLSFSEIKKAESGASAFGNRLREVIVPEGTPGWIKKTFGFVRGMVGLAEVPINGFHRIAIFGGKASTIFTGGVLASTIFYRIDSADFDAILATTDNYLASVNADLVGQKAVQAKIDKHTIRK